MKSLYTHRLAIRVHVRLTGRYLYRNALRVLQNIMGDGITQCFLQLKMPTCADSDSRIAYEIVVHNRANIVLVGMCVLPPDVHIYIEHKTLRRSTLKIVYTNANLHLKPSDKQTPML